MLFHAFYNYQQVGDVLLARLNEGKTYSYDKYDDLVVLKNHTNQIIGYNLLNASSYLGKLNDGLVKFTAKQIEAFNNLLIKSNLEPVVYDDSPKFIVGKVVAIEDHPDSDHLHICKVDLKSKIEQIVCGASNVALNQLVVVATIGAIMPSGMIIKPSKLRKVPSNGMICSARELNLKNAPQKPGILVLDETKYQIGDSFF